MFNIHIPQNFDSPYKARNFQDYWRRWHITLSRFLSTYIFRSVYKRDCKWRNYYIATMATFFVSGFWHGAGWTFIVWGPGQRVLCMHGVLDEAERLEFPGMAGVPADSAGRDPGAGAVRVEQLTDAWNVYRGMVNFSSLGSGLSEALAAVWNFVKWHKSSGLILVIGIIICWFLPSSKKMTEKFKPSVWTALYAGGLMLICVMQMNKVVQFLYFQF